MAVDKRIPELDPIGFVNGTFMFAMYDPATDTTYRVDLSQVLPAQTESVFEWDDATSYDTNEIVISDNKLWKSLIDDNLNNLPVEGANWTEVSKSLASAIQPWAAGVYTEEDVVVLSDHNGPWQFYVLVSVTRPYASADIAAEETAGDWEQVSDVSVSNVALAGAIITLPFKGASQRQFRTVAAHAANFTLAVSGATKARRFDYAFELGAIYYVELPVGFKMSDALYDSGTRRWTPDVAGKYVMTGFQDGADWLVWIRGPFS